METTTPEIGNKCVHSFVEAISETPAAASMHDQPAATASDEEKQQHDKPEQLADTTDKSHGPHRIDETGGSQAEEAHETPSVGKIDGADAEEAHDCGEEPTKAQYAEKLRLLEAKIQELRGQTARESESSRQSREENQELREKNQQLREENQELREKNQQLTAESRKSNDLLGATTKKLREALLSDAWLEEWDSQIFRCTKCNRPLGTRERLLEHQKFWHSANSPGIGLYVRPRPNGLGELQELMKDGDLVLTFKSFFYPSISYLVSSHVLCMTSRVFLKMFGRASPYKEAAAVRRANVLGSSPAVISLEDNGQAFGFILQLLHHRHDLVPQTLDFGVLVRVAAICDKYEFHGALKQTIDKYLDPYKTKVASRGYEDWLLVSYVFGYADLFTKASQSIILTGPWNYQNESFHTAISSVLSPFTPYTLIDKPTEKRKEARDKIRRHVESIQAEWSQTLGEDTKQICKIKDNAKECDALLFGHLVQSDAKYCLREDETWGKSLESISALINQIPDLYLPSMPTKTSVPSKTALDLLCRPGSLSHANCSWVPKLKLRTDTCIASIEGLQLSDFPSSGGKIST
ncbi:hypothetical protein FN846DRAFT_962707 [Sphaerosporella brunnea]|uniref:C2H2-type domain-containing protein n=1 Tax=Sphaerosporella brunnea TaxID=1250544 RepID=A0A5J5ENZ8_9PEZI|nr:hypothetical protein FN846DRAFT_962707 [Sphaerosporella brunnea]